MTAPERTAKERDELITRGLPNLKYLCSRYAWYLPGAVDRDDLEGVGAVALVRAAENYDPGKNTKFETYAEIRIRGAILDYLRALDPQTRSGRRLRRQVDQAVRELSTQLGREPEDTEIADHLGMTPEELAKKNSSPRILLGHARVVNEGEEDEERQVVELLADDGPGPLALCHRQELVQILGQLIDELPEKEKLVLAFYYYEGLNQREIGEVLGLTQGRISQVRTQALTRLRTKLKRIGFAKEHGEVSDQRRT